MGTAAQLLEWARSQLGVTENPPGSNRVHYWDDVDMHGDQGQPWCAAFVLAGLVHIDVNPVTRSVYVPQIIVDYRRAGRLFPIAAAQPGDQALFHIGQGHTGIVESVDPVTRSVTCIEGNTSSDNHGSQDNGGGVFRRTRHWSVVAGVGRPPFTAPLPPVPEDDMAQPFFLDTKGPDDLGRDSVWEVLFPTGDIRNWNGARHLPSLGELVAQHPPIVAAAADPSGDGVVLFGDDARQDERGHWVRSTYKILASP